MKVVVSGSSGLIGRALAASLEADGHQVVRLVRREPRLGGAEIRWDPERGEADRAGLEGADAVVHLAGENIASGRWTVARMARIRQSRVRGTRLVAEALAGLAAPPAVMACASAVGFYGDRGEERVDEGSGPGQGFLADVCREWEAAAAPAARADVRVAHLRFGVVLSASGGALARMLPPFRLGLGGRLGTGRQGMSWVALADVVGAIRHVVEHGEISGPVNVTAPKPVSNSEFTRTLARVLRRPAILPAPALVIRLALGRMGEELLLQGAYVLPRVLERTGYRFHHRTLEDALRARL